MSMEVDYEVEDERLTAPKRKRGIPRNIPQKELLVNLAPRVARRKPAKKRGSSVRVTIRNQLKLRRRKLRRDFFAMKRRYRIQKAKLDRDIDSLLLGRTVKRVKKPKKGRVNNDI